MLRFDLLEIVFDFSRTVDELIHWNVLVILWILKRAASILRKRKADPLDILAVEACKRSRNQ